MPRRVRRRATRTEVEPLDSVTLADLKRQLPEWLADVLLHRRYPTRGTADARLLELLLADPVTAPHSGLLSRAPIAAVWKAHRAGLLGRWSAEGHKGNPWGCCLERDPFDADPHEVLHRAVTW